MLPWVSAENVHGDGSGGLDMDFAETVTEDEHGVDALIRLTAESPGEIPIVAIGPLTNIAMAAVKDAGLRPERQEPGHHGRLEQRPRQHHRGWRVQLLRRPARGARRLEAGFRDITVVPWAPLTLNDAVFSREQLAGIEAIGTPLAKFFLTVCGPTLAFDESVGIPGTTHPDSLSVGVLLHPELVTRPPTTTSRSR